MDPQCHSRKPTTQGKKARTSRSAHSNPGNIHANNHIPRPHIAMPPNMTAIQIGTVMGSFIPIPPTNFPIPSKVGTTPTMPFLNYPQPFFSSPNSQPFIPNQQFGNYIPNPTSFANHMNPKNPVFTQSRDNKTKESEGHSVSGNTPNESWVKVSLDEKGRSNDLGSKAINLRHSSKFARSQRAGKGHVPSIARLNDLRTVVTNLEGKLTSIAEQHRMLTEKYKRLGKSNQMLSQNNKVFQDTMVRQQMQMSQQIFNMSQQMQAFMRMQQASNSKSSQHPFHSIPNLQYANGIEDDNEDDAEDGDEHEDESEHDTPLGCD